MKLRAALALLWGLIFVVQVHAETICEMETLDQRKLVSDYLTKYAKDCTEKEIGSFLEKHNIIHPSDSLSMKAFLEIEKNNFRQMVEAWNEISSAFARLSKNASETAQMKIIYKKLFERADSTKKDLKFAIDNGAFPDVATFYNDAWRFSINMQLLQSKDFDAKELPLLAIKPPLDADCIETNSELCKKTLKQGRELMLQWKLADEISATASDDVVFLVKNQIAHKEDLWSQYLYDSKPMLPLDIFLTDFMSGRWSKSDQFPDGFREPPRTQWFVAHPSFAVEYVSAVKDGEQIKPILYLEVIGANRWNKDERWFDLPVLSYFSGISFIVSYADRNGIVDFGYGGLLTFDNVYSVGFTRYSSRTGVFLSLDLANLYRGKYKPVYEKYKNKLKE